MFGISIGEIILTLVVALLVLGPKQLPQLASKIGLMLYCIKNYIQSLKTDFYYKSGAHDVVNAKNDIVNSYMHVCANLQSKPTVSFTSQNNFYSKIQPYQPELNFDYQPELFDE